MQAMLHTMCCSSVSRAGTRQGPWVQRKGSPAQWLPDHAVLFASSSKGHAMLGGLATTGAGCANLSPLLPSLADAVLEPVTQNSAVALPCIKNRHTKHLQQQQT